MRYFLILLLVGCFGSKIVEAQELENPWVAYISTEADCEPDRLCGQLKRVNVITGESRVYDDIHPVFDILALSPNNRYLLLIAERRLQQLDVHTDEVTTISDMEGDWGQIEWSPSGDRIAFLFSEKIGHDKYLYVMNADGTELRLASNQTYRTWGFWWSPDGQSVSLTDTATTDHIVQIDINTGQTREILDRVDPIYGFEYSRDGQYLLFVTNPFQADSATSSEIEWFDLEHQIAVKLVRNYGERLGFPQLVLDESKLLYWSSLPEQREMKLNLFDLDTHETMTLVESRIAGYTLSADRNAVAYFDWTDETPPQLCVIHLEQDFQRCFDSTHLPGTSIEW